jgi:hypothetical protein
MIGLLAMCAAMGACASAMGPQPGLLFTDIDANKQFDAGVAPGPAGSWVSGQSCAYSVLGMASWGDAGLDAAMEAAGITGQPLRNVAVDGNLVTIVWPFYTRYCTRISAYVPID